MHLTGHELTNIPSGVAAIAIIGGYLGVRSANRTTIKVAREERTSKREDELLALKRTVYVKVVAALNELVMASVEVNRQPAPPEDLRRRQVQLLMAVENAIAELALATANNDLVQLAAEARDAAQRMAGGQAAQKSVEAYALAASKLRASMQVDLKGEVIPTLEEQAAVTQMLLDARPPGQVFVTVPKPPAQPPAKRAWWKPWGRRPS